LAIDNNLMENAIRPTAVGKKNWLEQPQPLIKQKLVCNTLQIR
jgi:hypothetical protein